MSPSSKSGRWDRFPDANVGRLPVPTGQAAAVLPGLGLVLLGARIILSWFPAALLLCCVGSSSLRPHVTARLFCPWDSPGKNTGVGCHFLLQRFFLTRGSNPQLLHYQVDSSPLSHLETPFFYSLTCKIAQRLGDRYAS